MFPAGTQGPVHVVWSEFLGQGSEKGFAFVFHSDRLTGAAKPTTGTMVLLSESIVKRKTHSSLGSRLLHKDATPAAGTFGESKVMKESTYVVTDPEEARRIAAELGVDLGAFPGEKLAPVVNPPATTTLLSNLATVLHDLDASKVFEIAAEDVSRVEIVGPTPESPGRIVIRTPREIQVVNVSRAPVAGEDPIPVLIPRFEEFAPARVVRPR